MDFVLLLSEDSCNIRSNLAISCYKEKTFFFKVSVTVYFQPGKKMYYTGILRKKNPKFSKQELNLRPSDTLDTLPLSYRRLVGATIKDKG